LRLLVTRPQREAERSATTLRARGHDVLVAPLMRIEMIDCAIAQRAYRAVVMTSANAVHAIARHPMRDTLRAVPAFTVGDRTGEAARALGFVNVHSAAGARGDLIALIRARMDTSDGPILYLAGEDRSAELNVDSSLGEVVTATVYRAVKLAQFSEAAESELRNRQIEGVLHFSRRSADAYLDCARRAEILRAALAPVHYCLSQQVASALAQVGAERIRIAPRPHENALVELVSE
jgi:uroporphyrinogen-III synthase